LQAFIDKFRYNAKRASMVQSRIKALERLEELEAVEQDPEYVFKCVPLNILVGIFLFFQPNQFIS